VGWVMDGLSGEAYDRTYTDRQLLDRVLYYFRPQAKTMAFVSVMVAATSILDAAFPLLIAHGLDRLTDGQARFDGGVWQLTIAVFVFAVASWVFNFFRQSRTAIVVGNVVLKLREDAIGSVLKRDLSFYDQFSSGKVVSRVTSDTEDFSSVVTLTLNLLSQVLMIGIIVVALFLRDVRLAFITLTVTPVIIGIALGFRRIARDSVLKSQRAQAQVNSTLQETIRGISVAKNFRQEETIYTEFKDISGRSYNVRLRMGFVFAAIFPVLFFVGGLGTVGLVFFGGRDVLSGRVSAGDWFLFLQAIALFWLPLTSIASFWSQFQQGLAAAERVFALIDAEPRVVQTGNEPAGKLKGQIEFKHVHFGYSDDVPVLKDFSLTIKAGETVAFVGHTGAGKSTIGKLVARFYEFQDGEILIDGRDIRAFDLQSYRRQMGVVPQLPFLFSGTVADNIRYPKPGASDEEILDAARRIGGGDWIDALPNGLQTEVGEDGHGISMGQRQLVALARVLMQDAAIVVLDEATASVDPLTEAQIQEGLDVVLEDRTAIVIAHRLSTIRTADRIIVIDHGGIVEEGSHDQLIAAGGQYADLFNTYFRHQDPNYAPWLETIAAD